MEIWIPCTEPSRVDFSRILPVDWRWPLVHSFQNIRLNKHLKALEPFRKKNISGMHYPGWVVRSKKRGGEINHGLGGGICCSLTLLGADSFICMTERNALSEKKNSWNVRAFKRAAHQTLLIFMFGKNKSGCPVLTSDRTERWIAWCLLCLKLI